MNIYTRAVQDQDKEDCLWVEAGAIDLRYLGDVWEMFTRGGTGELTGAFLDGTLKGIGKFTRLFNGYAWLETLRVHPEAQGRGLGKAIYDRYMEEMTEFDVHAVGMYTGIDNDVSRGLAERYSLSVQNAFSELRKAADAQPDAPDPGFRQVPAGEGEAALSPHYEKMGGFAVVNRTFYPVRPGLGAHFAGQGWIHMSENGDIAVLGCRFQPEKALHLAYGHGDMERIIPFCLHRAAALGSGAISAVRPFGDPAIGVLAARGFENTGHDLITLWKGL